jgi:RNA-binding protein
MDDLTPVKRRALRAQAHHLQPVVAVGQHGLTPAVLHEIDLALLKHELIKVRVFADDRAEREAVLATIGAELACAPVQHLGKLLILYRENPDKDRPAPNKAAAKKRSGSGKKQGAKVTGTKAIKKTYNKVQSAARTPVDPVRERRRSTAAAGTLGKGTRGAARHQGAGAPPETVPPATPDTSRRRRRTPR